MGRWSQRRRRGGGPPEGATPVPPPADLNIASVTWLDAITVHVEFDADVTLNGSGSGGSSQFTILGVEVAQATQAGPTGIDLQMQSPVNPGEPWDLASQPAWTIENVTVPETGVVS